MLIKLSRETYHWIVRMPTLKDLAWPFFHPFMRLITLTKNDYLKNSKQT